MHIAQPFSAFLTHALELQQFKINPKYCLLCCIPLYSGPRNWRMLPIWPQLGLWQTIQDIKAQNKIITRYEKVQDGISVAILSSFRAQILNLSFYLCMVPATASVQSQQRKWNTDWRCYIHIANQRTQSPTGLLKVRVWDKSAEARDQRCSLLRMNIHSNSHFSLFLSDISK